MSIPLGKKQALGRAVGKQSNSKVTIHFSIQHCTFGFSLKQNLVKMNLTTKPWVDCHTVNAVCYVSNCQKTFTSFRLFISHLKQEHFNKKTGNTWKVCDYKNCGWKPKANGNDHFVQHLNTHYGNLDIFCCKFCGYKSCSKKNLKRHLKAIHRIIAQIRVEYKFVRCIWSLNIIYKHRPCFVLLRCAMHFLLAYQQRSYSRHRFNPDSRFKRLSH